MKSVKESINEAIVKGKLKQYANNITLETLNKDIEKICNDAGIAIINANNNKDKITTSLVAYKWIKEPSKFWQEELNDTITQDIIAYELMYHQETDYAKSHGYFYRQSGFILTIFTWYSDKLERPRYKINDFRLSLPSTRHQGFFMPYADIFSVKKCSAEFYGVAKQSLKDIIYTFAKAVPKMKDIFTKCSLKNNFPQRIDYNKIYVLFDKFIIQRN